MAEQERVVDWTHPDGRHFKLLIRRDSEGCEWVNYDALKALEAENERLRARLAELDHYPTIEYSGIAGLFDNEDARVVCACGYRSSWDNGWRLITRWRLERHRKRCRPLLAKRQADSIRGMNDG